MRVPPPGWITAPIGDLLATLDDGRTLHQGWSPLCEKEPSTEDHVWGVLKTTAIQPREFHPEQNKRLPEKLTPRPQIEVKSGDVLITCAGPRVRCGVTAMVRHTRPRLMMSGKMYRFRFDDRNIDTRYIAAFLQSAEARCAIDQMKTGGSDSGLNLTHDRFRRLEVPVAPYNEQLRIVAAVEEQFSRIDSGVVALERARQNLKRMRAAVLHAAVFGYLTDDSGPSHPSRLDDPGPNASESHCDDLSGTSHLPQLPHNWYWTMLGSAITDGPQNGLYLHRSNYGHGQPILRINDFQTGWTRARADLNLVAADPEAKDVFALHRGDLVINRVNSMTHLGKCTVVKPDLDGVLFESNMMRIRLNQTLVPQYLEMYLQSTLGRSLLVKNAKWAVNQASINQKDVRSTPVPLPPLETQKRIVTIFDQAMTTTSSIDAYVATSLQRSYSLRSAVLAAAFSGALVPHDPEDEPASVLLERIAAERASSNGHKLTRTRAPRTPLQKVSG